jgi:hypothetical protein
LNTLAYEFSYFEGIGKIFIDLEVRATRIMSIVTQHRFVVLREFASQATQGNMKSVMTPKTRSYVGARFEVEVSLSPRIPP